MLNVSPVMEIIKRVRVLLLVVLAILLMANCGTQPIPEQATSLEFLKKPSSQHIRVMCFNVGWDSIFPDTDPQNHQWRSDGKSEEFVRIVKAVDPDIICLQEINAARDPQQVGTILDVALPLGNGEKWQTHSGQDNIIVACFELSMCAEQVVHYGRTTNLGHAMALVDLPDADHKSDLYLICAHFRSKGGQSNIEARQEHADVIVQWIRDIRTPGDEIDLPTGTPFLVLGDFNVYDTDPAYHLTTLITGDIVNEAVYGVDISPDWDDTPLTDALPRHNAKGEEIYTWRDDTQEFNPGVLDHILYTDSVISVDNAFVLDTTIMTEEELEGAGLRAGDVMLDQRAGRYDHLPLVVDIKLGNKASRAQ